MTREVCRADVESGTGYRLVLAQIGRYWRSELFNPEGRAVHVAALKPSADEALESVVAFLDAAGIRHTGVVLAQQARAEMKFSEQEAAK